MRAIRCLLFLLVFYMQGYAQDSIREQRNYSLTGYIKDLQSLSFDGDFRNAISGNLLHNRLNFKWKPAQPVTAVAEIRTRLFWGEEMKLIPDFAQHLRNKNEWLNIQRRWINNESVILHSNVERLYLDLHSSRLELRLGRQRINWGVTTSWNPNDIFNAYNFLDFDYEERAGIDGAKARYLLNDNSNIEAAFAFLGTDEHAAAVKYAINRWNYDFQFIGGWYRKYVTAGTGWAGSIGDAGFKGEMQYYFAQSDSAGRLNLALEGDYMFKNGWYVNVSFLFNNRGLTSPVAQWNQLNLSLSPENLMPAKWNVLLSSAREISPLISVNMGILYAPGVNFLILMPSLRCNLVSNFDAELMGQDFLAQLKNHQLQATSHKIYLRMRWSF